MYYTLAFTNIDTLDITDVVITSPLPAWISGAWVDDRSTVGGMLDNEKGKFIFDADRVGPGETIYARTILRSYSTVSGEVANAFYVYARELAETKERIVVARASNAVCDEPATPVPTVTPSVTPTASPTSTPAPTVPIRLKLYLPLITMP